MMSRAGVVVYTAVCFATREVLEGGRPMELPAARTLAIMETIVRHDAMPEDGFATREECSTAIDEATFVVTPVAAVPAGAWCAVPSC